MKTRVQRVAAFLCAILTAVPLMQACGESKTTGSGNETQEMGTTASAETETTEELKIILDTLPEDIDYTGTTIRVRINDFDQTQYGANIFMMGPEEADGDVVHDAILERNKMVEERLGVKFTYELVSYQWDQVYKPTQKSIMAGDDLWDLFVDQQFGLLKVAADNMLYNFVGSEVNDFSQNYWWEEYMEQLQLHSSGRFLVAGDYFLDVVEVASAIFFNKAMYAEHYGDAEQLYQMAFDGKWTIDALGNYIKEFYTDVNGDGKVSEGDLFSMNMSRNFMDAQVFGSGITFMERDETGFPVLKVDEPPVVALVEKLHSNYFEPETTFNFGTVPGVTEAEYYQNQRKSFAERNLLFLNDYLAAVKDLRGMKDDYGILPIPKFDESIEQYRSVSHDTALVGAIPTTCQIPDKVCTVLEALCSMSHNTTMRVYFESAMKVKYARDEKSSQMIDLLHDSITSNFCYAFGPQINNYYEIFRVLFDKKSDAYATEYAKMQKAVEKRMSKIIETYEENMQG